MKLGIVSDLHLEFKLHDQYAMDSIRDQINSCEADRIVFAGDTCAPKFDRDLFLSTITKPYFSILGNHDYYTQTWYDDYQEDDLMTGGCLWTNFNNDPTAKYLASRYINDFRVIKGFTVDKCEEIYYNHLEKIFASDKEIVVTHFPPSFRHIRPEFAGDPLNGYFCNNLDERIMDSNKKLWICGHVHTRYDYMIGNCRVVSNDYGYMNEQKKLGPWTVKIIEI